MKNAILTVLLLLASCVSTPDVEGVIQDAPRGSQDRTVAPEPGSEAAGESSPLQLALELEARAYSREELQALSVERRAYLDARCRELLAAARAEDATYDDLMLASRALVFNADLRIQTDVAFRFDPADLPKPSKLIDAEDDVSSSFKSEVRSLATQSKDFADRALELRPNDAEAELFSTLGLGLSLWSMGAMQAIANGATSTLPKRIKQVAAAHPAFEGASPLRLAGRFQARAPWPYKDTEAGVATLTRAVEIAPIPLNLLFLGDAHWSNDEEEAAIATWTRGTQAAADAETAITSPLLREICRLRIESARQNQ